MKHAMHIVLLSLVVPVLFLAACSEAPTPPLSKDRATKTTEPGGTTVAGVVSGCTDGPCNEITVEFRSVRDGGYASTTTDARGFYWMTLLPGVYTALALPPDPHINIGFDVAARKDNIVELPPSTIVNFAAHAVCGEDRIPC